MTYITAKQYKEKYITNRHTVTKYLFDLINDKGLSENLICSYSGTPLADSKLSNAYKTRQRLISQGYVITGEFKGAKRRYKSEGNECFITFIKG